MALLEVLQIKVLVDLEIMAIKGYSTFLKAPGLKLLYYMVLCNIQDTHWRGVYFSVEMQSAYSTVAAETISRNLFELFNL